MSIRVTYVVATRNRASFIQTALPMWRNLKGPEDELIVVDGNSTDGTYEVLKAAPPGLIDVLIHEPDRSEAHAYNKGFLQARGSLLKAITDDDEFDREGLEDAYKALFDHPEIDVLLAGGECINRVLDSTSTRVCHRHWFPDDYFVRNPFMRIRLSGVGMIIRRASLAVTGLLDPRHLHADTSFLTQATVRGATIRYIRTRVFRQYLYSHSIGFLNQSRRTYIDRDFNFRGFSRWRFLFRPGDALSELMKQIGIKQRHSPHEGALWDGKLL